MQCDDIDALMSEAVDGRLAPADAVKFREHLATCRDCREQYRLFLETLRHVRELPRVQVPDDLVARIQARLPARRPRVARFVLATPAMRVALAACFVLAVSLFGLNLLTRQRKPAWGEEPDVTSLDESLPLARARADAVSVSPERPAEEAVLPVLVAAEPEPEGGGAPAADTDGSIWGHDREVADAALARVEIAGDSAAAPPPTPAAPAPRHARPARGEPPATIPLVGARASVRTQDRGAGAAPVAGARAVYRLQGAMPAEVRSVVQRVLDEGVEAEAMARKDIMARGLAEKRVNVASDGASTPRRLAKSGSSSAGRITMHVPRDRVADILTALRDLGPLVAESIEADGGDRKGRSDTIFLIIKCEPGP